ncbi:MAG: CopG family transcriptional regulator [Gloeomargaritaceae cyanobacterium C42_A2020_066]|nr:CopG family transcriptional regulator [Gloeomargaritaceae cyanobacterium C42_A2020_066]
MAVKDKHLSVRLTEYENQLLEHYCRAANQSKTDVIRAYIRSLDKKANV